MTTVITKSPEAEVCGVYLSEWIKPLTTCGVSLKTITTKIDWPNWFLTQEVEEAAVEDEVEEGGGWSEEEKVETGGEDEATWGTMTTTTET